MKKLISSLGIILIIAVLFVALNMLYNVNQKEYVVIKEFNKIVSITDTPGLHFKMPFIQNCQRISAAVHLYDIPSSDVITKDKKSMITDNYVLWKVTDPTKYLQTLNGLDARAEERVEAAVFNATKNVISSLSQDEVIAFRGEQLSALITEESNSDIGQYGITITSTQIKSLDLPNDNKEAVYQRMISERNNIAAGYTAQGQAQAQKIRNETDKQVTIKKADAEKQASILVAEGEAEYMKILAEAYNDPDKAAFYSYIRGLDALKVSLQNGEKTIMLDKDSELVRILYGQ